MSITSRGQLSGNIQPIMERCPDTLITRFETIVLYIFRTLEDYEYEYEYDIDMNLEMNLEVRSFQLFNNSTKSCLRFLPDKVFGILEISEFSFCLVETNLV